MDSLKKYGSTGLAYLIIFAAVFLIVRILASLFMFTVSVVAVAIIALFIWGLYCYYKQKGKTGSGNGDHLLP